MSRQMPRDDVICLAIPEEVDPHDPDIFGKLEQLAHVSVKAQWNIGGGVRPTIEFGPIDWLITDQVAQVDSFQPAHDCEMCRSGNERAREYLTENPGRFIAMGNIHYTEIWPGWSKL